MSVLIVLIGLLVSPAAMAGGGPSELVTDLRVVSMHYHENPARLDEIREGLEREILGRGKKLRWLV